MSEHSTERDARCWRSECRTACYYQDVCSERPTTEIDALRAAGYHVERQGTYDNRMKRLAVLESQLRWAEDEKVHHERWLAGILDESRRLQDRFNRIAAAMAASGVEWSVIAELIGDETSVIPPEE